MNKFYQKAYLAWCEFTHGYPIRQELDYLTKRSHYITGYMDGYLAGQEAKEKNDSTCRTSDHSTR